MLNESDLFVLKLVLPEGFCVVFFFLRGDV